MALINCPECNKQISSEATNCPQCGHPIKPVKVQQRSVAGTTIKVVLTLIGILFFVFIILPALCVGGLSELGNSAELHDSCTVERVIDGDTFVCSGEKIRLIGVDALELPTEQGKKATEYVKTLLTVDTEVKLEYDVGLKDRYQRVLAYVYLPSGAMLNEVLLRDGYAQVMTVPPNVKYSEKFLELEQEVREKGVGLW